MSDDEDPPSFHNTTGVKGSELAHHEFAAKTQEARLLKWMREHPTKHPHAEDAMKIIGTTSRTSAGRSLTNLDHRGFIEKFRQVRDGEFKRLIWRYALKPQHPKQGSLL